MAQYTELAMRLRLVPHSHNTKVPDCSFDLQFKSHAMADDMIAVDLRAVVKPALKALRSSTIASVRAISAESIQLHEQLDRLGELLEQRADEVSSLEAHVQEQERTCAAKKVGWVLLCARVPSRSALAHPISHSTGSVGCSAQAAAHECQGHP